MNSYQFANHIKSFLPCTILALSSLCLSTGAIEATKLYVPNKLNFDIRDAEQEYNSPASPELRAIYKRGLAHAYERRGKFYADNGELYLAEADYTRAANLGSFSGRARFYEKQKKFELAEADWNRAVQLEPEYNLSSRAQFYEEQKKFDLAEADWNRAVQLKPESYLYSRARFYERQKKFELAEADWNRAVQLKPESYLDDRAEFYEKQKKFELAEADWNRAVQLKPESHIDSRAQFYERQKKFELAEADWNRAVQLKPESFLDDRARFYENQKKFELAEADWNRAVQLKPESHIDSRAQFYERQKKFELAEADWNRAVQLKPESYLDDRAGFYENQKKFELAEADWNRAVQLKPEYNLSSRAQFYERQKKFELAEADWNRAVQLKPESHIDSRARFYEKQKKFELAEADWNRAVQLKPESYLDDRARFYERQKKFDLAEADWNRAVQLDPAKAAAKACFYERQGKLDLAAREITQAVATAPSKYNTFDKCRILAACGRNELAEGLAKELIATEGENLYSERLAELYLYCGNPRAAAETIAESTTTRGQYTLGVAYELLHDKTAAIRAYQNCANKELSTYEQLDTDTRDYIEAATQRLTALGGLPANKAKVTNQGSKQNSLARLSLAKFGTAPLPNVAASPLPSSRKPQIAEQHKPINIGSTASPQDRPIRDKWAVIVGVSKFKDASIPTLKFPAKDARDFYTFLTTKANFKPDHVRLLTDEKATRARIWTEIGDSFLPRVVAPDDLVVLYFSTHGSSPDRDIRRNNYLIAYDTPKSRLYADGIKMQDLLDELSSRTGADRVLIVLDACHSGAADPTAKALEFNTSFDIDQFSVGSGNIILTSSEPSESSYESLGDRNGIFTKHLIRVLSSNPKVIGAFASIKDRVSEQARQELGKRQTPRLKADGWEGKDLLITAPPAKPSVVLDTVKKMLEPDSAASSTVPSTNISQQTRKTAATKSINRRPRK